MDQDPDDIERHWYERVRRGPGVPQLTVRAVVLGALLGGVTGLSNLYVGLKTGWSLGVVVTASVLGWAVWTALRRLRVARSPMSILELNAMASTASAAGYSTGVNLVSAVAAYVMVVGHQMPLGTLTVYVGSVALLGLFMAIPVKRQLVNVERLPFPDGRAAAETLRALHADAEGGRARARLLLQALVFGAVLKWLTAGMAAVAELTGSGLIAALALPAHIPFAGAAAYTWSLELSVLFVGAGALCGWRVSWSFVVGGVLAFGIVGPWAVDSGAVAKASYRDIAQFTVWAGAPLIVVAALGQLAFRWRLFARTLAALGRTLRPDAAPIDAVEVPPRWFFIGSVAAAIPCVAVLSSAFDVPVALGIVGVVLSFVLTLVAARATGETNINPAGPLGKITQLTYGALLPGATVPNLVAAGVTVGTATSATDLLTDLKSGHLLGADPRKQFWAQLVGIVVGLAVVVPVFVVLIPGPSALGTEQWLAPAAQIWASVAQLLAGGVAGLPPLTGAAIGVGAATGLVLVVAEQAPRLRPYVPSATGLGLGLIMPAFTSIGFLIGGALALVVARRRSASSSERLVLVASGFIAGESLMGIAVALLGA